MSDEESGEKPTAWSERLGSFAEALAEGGVRELVPFGGLVVTSTQALTGRGKFSLNQKTMPVYVQAVSEDLQTIAAGVDEVRQMASNLAMLKADIDELGENLKRLASEKADESESGPEPQDVAAFMQQAAEAARRAGDHRKRRLLGRVVVNSFDVEAYESGVARIMIELLDSLEYGDVEFLRHVYESEGVDERKLWRRREEIVRDGREDADGFHLDRLVAREIVGERVCVEETYVLGRSMKAPGAPVFGIEWLGGQLLRFIRDHNAADRTRDRAD